MSALKFMNNKCDNIISYLYVIKIILGVSHGDWGCLKMAEVCGFYRSCAMEF